MVLFLILPPPIATNQEIKVEDRSNILTFEEMKTIEKKNIIRALNLTNWKISGEDGAAALLKIPRTTLTSKINKFSIKRVAM